MGFNLQLGDALRSESVTAIDDAIRAIARQEIDRTPRTKFCDACAYMHQPEISARCCCVACHGDDVPAWAQRMNTPPSIEKTGESASSGSASGRIPVLNADSPASPASVPEWVPSVDEIQQFIDDGREGDLRALIASRAPRASTVSVEDGSVRDVAEDVLSWLDECKLDGEDGQLRERLRAALAAMPASEAQGEAQGEPPTIEECRAAFDQACEDALKNPRLSRRAADYEGVAAVRTLCLSRAPSPSPALAAMIDEADATMSRILGRSFARHLPSVPTSPALAALVEAGDAMAATLRLIRNRAPLHEDYQRDIDRDVAAYDRARAALPKGGAA